MLEVVLFEYLKVKYFQPHSHNKIEEETSSGYNESSNHDILKPNTTVKGRRFCLSVAHGVPPHPQWTSVKVCVLSFTAKRHSNSLSKQ
jgi:hypothetical protein